LHRRGGYRSRNAARRAPERPAGDPAVVALRAHRDIFRQRHFGNVEIAEGDRTQENVVQRQVERGEIGAFDPHLPDEQVDDVIVMADCDREFQLAHALLGAGMNARQTY